MHGKSFFLGRVIARSRDWQCRFPALSSSWTVPGSLSGGRQIVASTADENGIRCAFFSNHGSILDFAATWTELEQAKTWWHFVGRWNFWVVDSNRTLGIILSKGDGQLQSVILGGGKVDRRDNDQFVAFLDRAETQARSLVGITVE
ncbi:hypothetical protein [Paraburkholderia sp. BL10I2N1]|uniref:hypothetical protein n=1 Tax=Paraburkholderia sp. BL10I2N1 TaxID=1938796 RepID=UPI00105D4EE6|nr:hypothetical protein [Paraburkholderia sp. BL10I2N1]TDN59065.1 hypothetical protein B0G77_8253 [Paraburkholderia sp. BL10I2N1]